MMKLTRSTFLIILVAPLFLANQDASADIEAMNDIGWQVSPIPEMEIWAMMLAGFGLLGWSGAVCGRG
jgi:hypothetical protein